MEKIVWIFLAACGTTSMNTNTHDPEQPPTTSAADVSAWLAKGYYKQWKCEAAPSKKTDGDAAIHVHGTNRVCVNASLAAAASPGASGAWPQGVAAVKEIYSGDTITRLYRA